MKKRIEQTLDFFMFRVNDVQVGYTFRASRVQPWQVETGYALAHCVRDTQHDADAIWRGE